MEICEEDTAVAFRKHPAMTDAPVSMRSVVIVDPYGDGKTSQGTTDPVRSIAGSNEIADSPRTTRSPVEAHGVPALA